jgi:hypothetical protein
VLEGYPSVFTSADLNRPGNLVNVDASFHRSQLRRYENRVYKRLDADLKEKKFKQGSKEYGAFVTARVTAARVRADAMIRRHASGKLVPVPASD